MMNLNKTELRKISYLFHSMANRLLQANFEDHTAILQKFCRYIQETPLIHDYVSSFGSIDYDVGEDVEAVASSYGQKIFALGDDEADEVRNVYAILTYIADNNRRVAFGIGKGYTSSNKRQDIVRAFNDRVVMVLIRHIDNYLVRLGIDMGLDDKVVYQVQVNNGNGQVSIAMDGSTIHATNTVNIGSDSSDVIALLNAAKDIVQSSEGISDVEKEQVSDDLDIISEQLQSEEPKKSRISSAIARLKKFSGDLANKVAVSTISSALIKYDWVGLWEKIEPFIQ